MKSAPMSQQSPQFHPFFDPWRGGKPLRSPEKISIALLVGGGVTALQYFSVADKQVFFDQESWIKGWNWGDC